MNDRPFHYILLRRSHTFLFFGGFFWVFFLSFFRGSWALVLLGFSMAFQRFRHLLLFQAFLVHFLYLEKNFLGLSHLTPAYESFKHTQALSSWIEPVLCLHIIDKIKKIKLYLRYGQPVIQWKILKTWFPKSY